MRILIVDDEGSLLFTLVANFELEGFEVVSADNPLRALELIKEQDIDLVLTDVRMPGMNGVELFRRIREQHPQLPVILMTGFALEGLVDEAVREGIFTVLFKPFEIDHAVAVLSRALRRPRILVVDDMSAHAESLAAALSSAGLACQATVDAATAIEAVRGGGVDVCAVDLVIPGTNVPNLIERILKLDPSIAVIAMSGYSVPELLRKVTAMGVFACMRKPFAADELIQTIAKVRGRAFATKDSRERYT